MDRLIAHRKQLNESLIEKGVPQHNHDALVEYVMAGRPVGGFLQAVLSNDLRESFGRADTINRHNLREIVEWLFNNAPANCWGSVENYKSWLVRGGLEGIDNGR